MSFLESWVIALLRMMIFSRRSFCCQLQQELPAHVCVELGAVGLEGLGEVLAAGEGGGAALHCNVGHG